MSNAPEYIVRDSAGNIYGPASLATIRQWVGEHRVTGNMAIAPAGTGQWGPIGEQAELRDLFAGAGNAAGASGMNVTPVTPVNTAGAAGGWNSPGAPNYSTPTPTMSSMAIAAFICSLISLPVSCFNMVLPCFSCVGLPLAITGLVLGVVSLGHINNSQGRATGAGFAKAGIIIGIIALVMMVVLVVLFFSFGARGGPRFGLGGVRMSR